MFQRITMPDTPGYICGLINCCEGQPERRARGDWHGIHGAERVLAIRDGDVALSVLISTGILPPGAPEWSHNYEASFLGFSVHAAWPWGNSDDIRARLTAVPHIDCAALGAPCFEGSQWGLLRAFTDVLPSAPNAAIFAELERLANHFNDLGFIMLDTGFSFGGSHGARLRERIMQWNERISGSRFYRGMIVFGGVSRDMEESLVDELSDDLALLEADFKEVIEIAKDSDSLLNRLKETGRLDKEIADDYGVIGVGARALGKEMDARVDYPYAAYEAVQFSVATESYGDVHARFQVRIKEVYQSFRILNQVLALLPFEISPIKGEVSALPANRMAVGIVEGWRGDIVTFVMTDAAGKIFRVKVRDTSFVNWQIFSHVLLRDIVPDFPLINKSFDLSYSGNDL